MAALSNEGYANFKKFDAIASKGRQGGDPEPQAAAPPADDPDAESYSDYG